MLESFSGSTVDDVEQIDCAIVRIGGVFGFRSWLDHVSVSGMRRILLPVVLMGTFINSLGPLPRYQQSMVCHLGP